MRSGSLRSCLQLIPARASSFRKHPRYSSEANGCMKAMKKLWFMQVTSHSASVILDNDVQMKNSLIYGSSGPKLLSDG